MTTRSTFPICVILVASLAGCGDPHRGKEPERPSAEVAVEETSDPVAGQAGPVADAAAFPGAGGTWRLTEMTEKGKAFTLPPEAEATLQFSAEGKVGGKAFINRFFSQAILDPGQQAGEERGFSWGGPFGSTRMAGPEDLMNLESTYLRLLEQAVVYHMEGARLVLHDKEYEVRLVFEQMPGMKGK